MPDKRIDPADGLAYTLDEMRKFYSGEYTNGEVVAYWNTCAYAANPKMKAKAKAKQRAPKSQEESGKQPKKRVPAVAEEVVKRLAACKAVPVIKLENAEHAIPLVTAMLEGGIDIAEITFRTACAAEAIQRASTVEGVCVGAGTVLEPKQVDLAVDMGADFIISPGFSAAVCARCRKRRVLYIPAVVTPTEVMSVTSRWGLKFLKFFPASNFGGVGTLKSYSAVFPEIKFMPTGGVTETNINEFLALPNVIAAGGSWFVADAAVKKAVETGDWKDLAEGAKKAKAAADAKK
mmetsp:Transcript_24670/g.68801  ORF Transcript_24670/g.68801 Transcript_24670/m.68801 type:complete len:291 (+) Transcript_24670:90-962(+)|eukprot:CAMPEP_0117495436 /NCGR_PEP_ID=MMETSP0784-20121206/20132_1 /TAXON_ID=39447 /ORGANISM="" /LENGTH=290 /DNA_ID=CAMNT_0005290359 /DNA_START=89 /DNA_END=961 /DNA_ORIENTATION=+